MEFRTDAEADGLATAKKDGVLRIRFERPDRRNALTRAMIDRLIHHVENAVDHPDVRVIVIEGEGDHFCSGADLRDVNKRSDVKPRVGDIQRRVPRQAHRLIPAILDVQLPVVSVVRGIASGIGAHIAFASDFIVAGESVRFVEPFVDRGFTPDSGGTFLLTRLVGLARAREVVLLGREIDAESALRWELVHAVAPDAELEAASAALIESLCSAPTIALGLTKAMMNRACELSAADALANEAFALELSSRTKDFREGMAAFAEKRAPRYEGH